MDPEGVSVVGPADAKAQRLQAERDVELREMARPREPLIWVNEATGERRVVWMPPYQPPTVDDLAVQWR